MQRTLALLSLVVLALLLATAIAIPVLVLTHTSSEAALTHATAPWRPDSGSAVHFPHEGAPQLDKPSFVSGDGIYLEQDVNISFDDGSGEQLYLKYKAKLIQDWQRIFALDFEEKVVSVHCAPGAVTIEFATDAIATEKQAGLPANTLLTGSAEWGCSYASLDHTGLVNASDEVSTIQHRVVGVVGMVGASLSLRVERVDLTELFEDLEIHLESRPVSDVNETDPEPTDDDAADAAAGSEAMDPVEVGADEELVHEDGHDLVYTPLEEIEIPPPSPPTAFDEWPAEWPDYSNYSTIDAGEAHGEEAAGTHGRQLFFRRLVNFARDFTGRVTNSVAGVVRTANTVARGVSEIARGNIAMGSNSRRHLASFQWNGRDLRRDGNGFDFRRSYTRLGVGVIFNINIRSWRLTSAELLLDGDVTSQAAVTVSVRRRLSFDQQVSLVRGVQLGFITVKVGPVPIRIAGQLDIDAFVRAGVTGEMHFSAGVGVSSNARVGIRFRDGQWGSVRNQHWDMRPLPPSLSAYGTLDAGISIVPSISLIANWIGGPSISISPYVAAEVRGQLLPAQTCAATLGWGIDVMVGARIDLQNPVTGNVLRCEGCTHVWRSRPVLSTGTQPLMTCPTCNTCRRS